MPMPERLRVRYVPRDNGPPPRGTPAMTAKIIVTCPDCKLVLERHQRKSHSKLYCPAKGAPAKQPRKCRYRECVVMFVPKPGNPQQEYCSKSCWKRETSIKRSARYMAGKVVLAEDDAEQAKELAHMLPLQRLQDELEKQAAQYAPVMGEALVEITLKLMRPA